MSENVRLYEKYHRELYPRFYTDNPPHWYGRFKTLENCVALAAERDELRERFDAAYDIESDEAHYTITITVYPSLIRDVTARVCLRCEWASWNIKAKHGEWRSVSARRQEA